MSWPVDQSSAKAESVDRFIGNNIAKGRHVRSIGENMSVGLGLASDRGG